MYSTSAPRHLLVCGFNGMPGHVLSPQYENLSGMSLPPSLKYHRVKSNVIF